MKMPETSPFVKHDPARWGLGQIGGEWRCPPPVGYLAGSYAVQRHNLVTGPRDDLMRIDTSPLDDRDLTDELDDAALDAQKAA
jgi:hypothetical protein